MQSCSERVGEGAQRGLGRGRYEAHLLFFLPSFPYLPLFYGQFVKTLAWQKCEAKNSGCKDICSEQLGPHDEAVWVLLVRKGRLGMCDFNRFFQGQQVVMA